MVLDALSAHLAEYGQGDDGLIFAGEEGRPLRRTRFSHHWRPVAAWAGLEPGVGFHVRRHFYASSLIRYGESVKVVQERLGHASASETLDTYSHLWPDAEDRTREAVERHFRGLRCHVRVRVAVGLASPLVSGCGDGEPACRRGSVPGLLAGSGSVTIHLCGLPGVVAGPATPS